MVERMLKAHAATASAELEAVQEKMKGLQTLVAEQAEQLRRAAAAKSSAIISQDLIKLTRDNRETELLTKALEAITPLHRIIKTLSPQGFSSVKPEHLAQMKAMIWAIIEAKLHRIKVALNELDREKAETDAAIAAASDDDKAEVAAERKPVLLEAQARLREIIGEEITDCTTRRRISAVTRLEPQLYKYFPAASNKREFQNLPKTQEAFDEYVQAVRDEHKLLTARQPANTRPTPDTDKAAAANEQALAKALKRKEDANKATSEKSKRFKAQAAQQQAVASAAAAASTAATMGQVDDQPEAETEESGNTPGSP